MTLICLLHRKAVHRESRKLAIPTLSCFNSQGVQEIVAQQQVDLVPGVPRPGRREWVDRPDTGCSAFGRASREEKVVWTSNTYF